MKKIDLKKIPSEFLRLIEIVSKEADIQNIDAYLVGGFVRDVLIEKKNLDIDIVVEFDAIELAKEISQKHKTTITSYPHFGTATLSWESGAKIDLASARKERYSRPGALPIVSAGVIRDDLMRRDFTINAMAISINKKSFGVLVDEFHGFEDLMEKKIRVFHEKSFIDDPTRILRAIRFEQRLGFQIEKQTREFLIDAIESDAAATVTPGRYLEEFKKILKEAECEKHLKRLGELGGLGFIHLRMSAETLNVELLKSIGRSLEWFQENCDLSLSLSRWIVYFMGILDSLGLDEVRNSLEKSSLSRKDQEKVFSSKTECEVIGGLLVEAIKPSQAYKILNRLSLEELVFFLAKTKDESVKRSIEKFLTDYRHIKILTDGKDLIGLGVTDGKQIKEILQNLLYKKIDGELQTKGDEDNYLQQMELK
ncbi:MAG: hypothetical protein P9M07_03560 [Candidatus Aceula meridiana]|nr:hypothetical protein [Candidatus Aceula meridiana]